jgi:hypothetical protein
MDVLFPTSWVTLKHFTLDVCESNGCGQAVRDAVLKYVLKFNGASKNNLRHYEGIQATQREESRMLKASNCA